MVILKNILQFLLRKKILLIAFVFVFILFFLNTLHEHFPDEYDNILGGFYITQGILPYKGFFSHHGPLAYFFAFPITIFTHRSFVHFRIFLSIIWFLMIITSYLILKKRLSLNIFWEFICYAIILGFAATYFWGHMLLADTLSGYLLIPVYVLLLLKVIFKQKINLLDLSIISLLTCLSFFVSITYTYLIIIFNLYAIYFYISQNQNKFGRKEIFRVVIIFILPYFVFLTYFILTSSLKEFYQQAILYNKNTYIYNYPRPAGSTSLNPIRYAIVITHDFLNNYRGLLTQVKDFNLEFPFNITLAVANTVLIIYFLVQKLYLHSLFLLLTLIFSNPRSNPLTSKETDFQSAVYIMISLFNLPFIISLLHNNVGKILNFSKRLFLSVLFFITVFYGFFFFLFISFKFFDKVYLKYMGLAPLIYDRPQVAPIINKLITQDDFFWIGPHEFEELLYINGKLPSKYHWYLRAHSETPWIKEEIMSDLRKNQPKLIVFKRDYSEYGQNPSSLNSLMVNFLKENYFQIGDIVIDDKQFTAKIKDLHDFNLDEQFYFNNQRKEEIIQQLLSLGLIEPK